MTLPCIRFGWARPVVIEKYEPLRLATEGVTRSHGVVQGRWGHFFIYSQWSFLFPTFGGFGRSSFGDERKGCHFPKRGGLLLMLTRIWDTQSKWTVSPEPPGLLQHWTTEAVHPVYTSSLPRPQKRRLTVDHSWGCEILDKNSGCSVKHIKTMVLGGL